MNRVLFYVCIFIVDGMCLLIFLRCIVVAGWQILQSYTNNDIYTKKFDIQKSTYII